MEEMPTKTRRGPEASVMEQTMDRLEDFRAEEVEAAATAADVNSSYDERAVDGGGLLWRGVVAVLCVLWASNFAVAKLIMAEPGTSCC